MIHPFINTTWKKKLFEKTKSCVEKQIFVGLSKLEVWGTTLLRVTAEEKVSYSILILHFVQIVLTDNASEGGDYGYIDQH